MRVVMVALILLLILVLVGSPAWSGLRSLRSVPLPRALRPRRLYALPSGRHRRHGTAPAERAPLA